MHESEGGASRYVSHLVMKILLVCCSPNLFMWLTRRYIRVGLLYLLKAISWLASFAALASRLIPRQELLPPVGNTAAAFCCFDCAFCSVSFVPVFLSCSGFFWTPFCPRRCCRSPGRAEPAQTTLHRSRTDPPSRGSGRNRQTAV